MEINSGLKCEVRALTLLHLEAETYLNNVFVLSVVSMGFDRREKIQLRDLRLAARMLGS